MKKILLVSILAFSFSANAQTAAAPAKAATAVPATPAQPAANQVSQPPLDNATREARGYSAAFLAYHYNDVCKLGISKSTIDTLASELAKSEQAHQISKETIDKNIDTAQKIYANDPAKFCDDAKKIAALINQLYTPK